MHRHIQLALLLTILLAAVRCVNATPTPTLPFAPDVTPTAVPTLPPTIEVQDVGNLTDAEKRDLMFTMSEGSATQALAALEVVGSAEDEQFIPVLIELVRSGQLGITPWATGSQLPDTLEQLSGQTFGNNWFEWIEWYGATDIEPPDGFTGWKGTLMSRIDSRFNVFFQDDHPSNLRVEEIQWGGVRLDGIPALDYVNQVEPAEASYLEPTEPVFGLSINGDSRAYPLRMMDWHEMANDEVGGVPVSIAYCTLCGAAVAFDGRASNGETYDFGSSGFLYRSNKLMYDRQTGTLWNQLTGEPVLGPLADDDLQLDVLPILLTTWSDWHAQHPDTTVLDIDTGFRRDYTLGKAYASYFSSADTMFPVWQRSDLLPDKSHIYALRINGEPKAYPIEAVLAERVVNDELAGTSVVLVAAGEMVRVEADGRTGAQVSYTSGAQVRAYERGDHQFTAGSADMTLVDETGTMWTVTEDGLISEDGATLPRLGGHLAYWFGWFAFFPNTAVYGQ